MKVSDLTRRISINILNLGLVNIINLVTPLLITPLLLRIFGSELYGKIIFIQAIYAFAIILIEFGFNLEATREASVYRKNLSELRRIYSEVILGKLSVSIVIFSILFFTPYVFKVDDIFERLWYINMYQLVPAIFSLNWLYQGLEKMKHVTISNSINKLSTLCLVYTFVSQGSDLFLYHYILAITSVLGVVYLLTHAFFRLNITLMKIQPRLLALRFKHCFAIFISNISIKIYAYSNRIFIGLIGSMDMVALYDVSEKIISALKIPQQIISQSLYPVVSENWNKRLLIQILYIQLLFYLLVYVLLAQFGQILIDVLSGDTLEGGLTIMLYLGLNLFLVPLSNALGIQTLIIKGFVKEFRNVIVSSALIYVVLMVVVYLFNELSVITIVLCNVLVELIVVAGMYRMVRKLKIWR